MSTRESLLIKENGSPLPKNFTLSLYLITRLSKVKDYYVDVDFIYVVKMRFIKNIHSFKLIQPSFCHRNCRKYFKMWYVNTYFFDNQ